MYKDKNKNITIEEKKNFIIKNLYRIATKIGLNLNKKNDFEDLIKIILDIRK